MNAADAILTLSTFPVIGCLLHVSRVQVLITNSGSNSELGEKVYIEPADPDLNQVDFIRFCQLKTYSATLSLFISLRATGHRTGSEEP